VGISSEFKYVAACSLSAAVGVALIGIPAPASADQINGLAAVSAATRVEPQNRPGALGDPATWTDKQLAAQLLLVGATSSQLKKVKSAVREGIGGIVLFGTPPANLASKLAGLRAIAPGNRLLVSSDEEGGRVQRLAALIGKMPSAKSIGQTKTPEQTRALAFKFGKRMKQIGIGTDLAPVADLAYAGSWTDTDGRAFKSNPKRNGVYVTAFAAGLKDAGVMATVKHWPGGGAVTDTHVAGGKTPRWSKLKKRDLVPFQAAFAAGVGGVMVSHASIPGLTGGVPGSQSRPALQALRGQAGDRTLIITDSLAMAAVTTVMEQSQSQAAVRALVNGADLALIQSGSPLKIRNAIIRAMENGRLPREQAVASARRILSAQQG
jgi:beta-N-acetylhexosaminidase